MRTAWFVIQEGSAVVAAGIIVGLGGLVVVRPSLAVSGAILVVAGGLGLRSLSSRVRGTARTEAVSR